MFRRFAPLALLILPLAPAYAQPISTPAPVPAEAPKPANVRVSLQTSLGPIVL